MPTKAQIDALVDWMTSAEGEAEMRKVNHDGRYRYTQGSYFLGCWSPPDTRTALYLAAGLTAEGMEKPEVERVYAVIRHATDGEAISVVHGTWDGTVFTPDGAP